MSETSNTGEADPTAGDKHEGAAHSLHASSEDGAGDDPQQPQPEAMGDHAVAAANAKAPAHSTLQAAAQPFEVCWCSSHICHGQTKHYMLTFASEQSMCQVQAYVAHVNVRCCPCNAHLSIGAEHKSRHM